jgi:hypothetical protein
MARQKGLSPQMRAQLKILRDLPNLMILRTQTLTEKSMISKRIRLSNTASPLEIRTTILREWPVVLVQIGKIHRELWADPERGRMGASILRGQKAGLGLDLVSTMTIILLVWLADLDPTGKISRGLKGDLVRALMALLVVIATIILPVWPVDPDQTGKINPDLRVGPERDLIAAGMLPVKG